MGKSLEKIFGEMNLRVFMGDKEFARIEMENNNITINITSLIGLMEAMLVHIFKKERISSKKLSALKKAGYNLKIKYRSLEKSI